MLVLHVECWFPSFYWTPNGGTQWACCAPCSTVCAISSEGRCELAAIPLLLAAQVPPTNQPQRWGTQPTEGWWRKSCFLLWPTYRTAAAGQFEASYAEAEHNARILVMKNSPSSGFTNTFASLTMHLRQDAETAFWQHKARWETNNKNTPRFNRKRERMALSPIGGILLHRQPHGASRWDTDHHG